MCKIRELERKSITKRFEPQCDRTNQTQHMTKLKKHKLESKYTGKSIFKKCAAAFAAAAILVAVSANAAMGPIYSGGALLTTWTSVTTPGVVGTAYGTTGQGQGNWSFQSGAAQAILNLGIGGSGTYGNNSATHANTIHDYFGTVNAATTISGGSANTSIPSGWNFVIAKYDGQNAGYVVYYLGGAATTIPAFPANYWTTDTSKYGISGWTAFNPTPVPEPTNMIAGALLMLPFAASTLRYARRKKKA
jgi:hypothetical protein